jgi:hypothetical protein
MTVTAPEKTVEQRGLWLEATVPKAVISIKCQ